MADLIRLFAIQMAAWSFQKLVDHVVHRRQNSLLLEQNRILGDIRRQLQVTRHHDL